VDGPEGCEQCWLGYSCPTGATYPTACAPGTTAAALEQSTCDLCPAGRYQDAESATACLDCVPGSYCAEGAAAALPCLPGTYSSATDLGDKSECTVTDPGHFAPTGSTEQTPCAPGTSMPDVGAGVCPQCLGGTYQDTPGQETCKPCDPGAYCAEGAAAALPCFAGTYSTATDLSSADQCTPTVPGYISTTGSTQPKACAPGTFQRNAAMGLCQKCIGGSYQDAEAATACLDCVPGSYCAEGAAAALPCLPGTYSSATDLQSAEDCTVTDPGHFAATGVTVQTPCAAGTVAPNASMGECDLCVGGKFQDLQGKLECKSCQAGSYCPQGAGAPLPCLEGSYSSATNLSSHTQCLPTEPGYFTPKGSVAPLPCGPGSAMPNASMAACDKCVAGKYQPAYGSTSCFECDLLGYCEEGAAGPSPCPTGRYGHKKGLRSAEECAFCPVGGYCMSGEFFPCSKGMFNVNGNSTDATACTSCSAHFRGAENLVTKEPGAWLPEMCGCDVLFYDGKDLGAELPVCEMCDSETMVCEEIGLTVETIPVAEGYWRLSNRTVDIHECNVPGNFSACISGVDGTQCAEGHTGPRCEWCVVDTDWYDIETGTCQDCGDIVTFTLKQTAIIAAVAVGVAIEESMPNFLVGCLMRCWPLLAGIVISTRQFNLESK
jgi:hypothetical protein